MPRAVTAFDDDGGEQALVKSLDRLLKDHGTLCIFPNTASTNKWPIFVKLHDHLVQRASQIGVRCAQISHSHHPTIIAITCIKGIEQAMHMHWWGREIIYRLFSVFRVVRVVSTRIRSRADIVDGDDRKYGSWQNRS